MKKPLLFLALGLSLALNSAYADTYSATISGDGYQFSNSFSGNTSFDDYISFTTEGIESIVASVSGSSGATFSFTAFDLLDTDKNLITTGSIFNFGAKLSFGGLESAPVSGNFYLHVVGTSTGNTAGYDGTIVTTAVPEPETFALMLAGIGLMGAIGRRKLRQYSPGNGHLSLN